MKRLEGTLVALATPFKGGELDEPAYRGLIRYVLDGGLDGLVPIGTTGEASTMSAEERFRAVKVAVDVAASKVPVVAGAGTYNTLETIANVAAVREAGADAALVVTPYYNKPTQHGLVEHYRAIAKAHPSFPLVVYNVPGRTQVEIAAETYLRLCDIAEVAAVKEATSNLAKVVDTVALCGDRLPLLSGDDFTVVPFMACGGRGVISVSANVAPKMMNDLVRACLAGDFAKGRAVQTALATLHRLLFIESNPIPVKWALHRMKKMGPELRLPLTVLSSQYGAPLEAELTKLGLLK